VNRAQQFVLAQFALFALFGIGFILLPFTLGGDLRWMGGVLIVIGGVILALAIYEHNVRNQALPNIEPTPNQKVALIDSGLYSQIRHPIYTAVLTVAFGIALFHGHIALLALACGMVIFFTYKSMYEETLLTQAYSKYEEYVKHTGRFLPFL